MSGTPIDYLTQLAPPRTKDGVAASRPREVGPPFDRHFQQVSGAGATTAPPPARSTADHRDEGRRSYAHSDSSSAPSTPSQSQPVDDAQNSNANAAGDDSDREADEPSTDEATVVAVSAPAEQLQSMEIVADAADAVPEPVDETATALVKPSRKPTDDAPPAAAGDAESDAAVRTSTADEASEANGTPTHTADSEAAESKSTTKQQLAERSAETSPTADAESAAAEEPTGNERVASQYGESRKSKSASEATIATTADQPDEAQNATSAQNAQGVAAASAPAGRQSRGSSSGTSTGTRSEKASGKGKSTADGKSPGAQTTSNDATAAQLAQANALRAEGGPSAPVAAAIASSTGVTDNAAAANSNGTAVQPKNISGAAKEGVLATFARLDRGGLLGGRGTPRTGEAQDAPRVDPARFVSRVARAIQTAHERGTPLLLRLNPPELGSLRLELSVQQGALSATVEADNQNARQALIDNLPALRDRLADQNIRIERFDVDVRRDGDGREPSNSSAEQQQDQQNGGPSHRRSSHRGAPVEAAVEHIAMAHSTISNTSINVVA